MKEIILYLLGLLILGFADPQFKDYLPKKYQIDDKETLERHLKILLLFKNNLLSDNFNPENNFHLFSEPKWLSELLKCKLLKKGEIFSVNYQENLDQAILLFRVFYNAVDFETLLKTATWSRGLVNERMWLYSLSVALVHRPDTFGIVLPPIYEISPHFFFNNEVINKAQQYAYSKTTNLKIEDDVLNRYTNLDLEQLLSYFTEDVELNSFYYYYHIFYPWWMDGKEFGLVKDRRGEIFYFVMAELVARYNAERLSNGLAEISAIDFESALDFGYYPSLRYPNGVEFPSRPEGVRLKETRKNTVSRNNNFTNAYTRLRDFAFRIQNVVDLGRAYTAVEIYKEGNDGLEILSNLLESNPNSPDLPYYGSLQIYARHLLGYAPEPLNKEKAIPAAIEHYETTLRDPVSWRFFKWLLKFYDDFYKHSRSYRLEELQYVGVTIDSIDVNEFITFFSSSYFDISTGILHSENINLNEDFNVYVQQKQLNHLPFVYNISLSSSRKETALIKVFLGPKYDQYGQILNITENNDKFYLMDYFFYDLELGHNFVIRNSSDSPFSGGRNSYKNIVDRINKGIREEKDVIFDGSDAYWSFPQRLILPKGTVGGMKFQLYAIVIKSSKEINGNADDQIYRRVGTGGRSTRTLRFPLDRKIEKSTFFVSNSFITDVIIRHDDKH